MGEAVAEVVRVAAGEDLGLCFEAAEGAGGNDAIAVALKGVAVGGGGVRGAASAGAFDVHRVAGEHVRSLAEYAVAIAECREKSEAGNFCRAMRNRTS